MLPFHYEKCTMTAKQSLKTKKSDRCQTLLSSIDWISKFQMNTLYGLQE